MEFINSNNKSSVDIIDLSKPILISMESFQTLTDAKVVSDDGRKWHINLMSFDTMSRNNNFYPADDTRRSFKESSFVQENLYNRTWFGELEHPPATSDLSRFLFIEPTRYAWNIQTLEDKGDHFEGDVVLCNPLGTSIALPNIKELGSNYASSCRIYTPNFVQKDGPNGKCYIKKYKMHVVTFDLVSCPGIPNCRLVDSAAYKAATTRALESVSTVVFNNPESTIRDMLKSSESAKVLEDYVGASFKHNSACIIGNKVRYSTDDGINVDVPLNTHLLNEVLK